MHTFIITLSNGSIFTIPADTRAEACNVARDGAGNPSGYLSYEGGYVYITKVECNWAN